MSGTFGFARQTENSVSPIVCDDNLMPYAAVQALFFARNQGGSPPGRARSWGLRGPTGATVPLYPTREGAITP